MQTLCKAERLFGKKQVDFLFEKGERLTLENFVIVWIYKNNQSAFPAKVLISVPKKKIGKATARNKLKRLIKEAYRKQKKLLYKQLVNQKKQIQFAIIYQNPKTVSYKAIESEINSALNRLINKL
jgi:ribonuclease P protein component